MSIATQARDRAEEMLHQMQRKAREFLDAEQGLARTARDLIEQKGFAPAEVRRNLEDLVGRIRANKIFESIRNAEPQELWTETVGGIERRVDDSMHWLLSTLRVATTEEMKALRRELNDLKERIDVLDQRTKPRAKARDKDATPDDAA
jgi:polyhydroxyalkanoate synthesis regulator phasin